MKLLGLYIHIPFCVRKCNYCDFLSFPCDSYAKRKEYIYALIKQIEDYKEISRDYLVDSIFIGGGTPSILDEDLVVLLFKKLKEVFNIDRDAEITIEGNPDSLNTSKLKCYKSLGINRLSIGLQSTNDNELKVLGRPHNMTQFINAYNSARAVGFSNINIDIMSALPGQNMELYGRTLAKVIDFSPEHISSYSLIIEEGTNFYNNQQILASLPDEDLDRKMYDFTKQILKRAGYSRYEISNYSKKGYACKHNVKYWTGGDYIGLGLGASSCFEGERYRIVDDINMYIDLCNSNQMEELKKDCIKLSVKDMIEEYMFLGLRLIKGVSILEFNERFDKDIYEIYGEVIDKYVESQHIKIDGDLISLTDKGLDVCNHVMADFLIDDEGEFVNE